MQESPPQPIRLILGQRASEALTATGESAFVVIGKASLPDDPARWVIHLLPVPMATAAAACEVAQGTRKPGKRVSLPPAAPEAAAATIDGKMGTTLDTTA